ncbi:MAG: peptidoglycan-associated lipoprotein Pal [Hyphomicrobiales bacterium]|nr:peptidoglycan-associated lipoprotein Pal [Hyphomicrobiales bacterium]
MVLKYLPLFALILTVSACKSKNDVATQDPAPVEYSSLESEDGLLPEDVSSSRLSELTPGSQEELVATVGDRVFFDFNSAALSAEAQKTMQRQAEWLKSYPETNVIIEGHCDERGTREYNLALGERRAKAAKDYLVSTGVAASRVSTISYGKEHPEFLESNEEAWSKNRRAVTVVINR